MTLQGEALAGVVGQHVLAFGGFRQLLTVVRLIIDRRLLSEQLRRLFMVEQLPVRLVAVGGEARHGVGAGEEFHIPLVQGGQAAKLAGRAVALGWPVLVDTLGAANGQTLDNPQAQSQMAVFVLQVVVPLAGIYIRRQHGDIVPAGVLHQL